MLSLLPWVDAALARPVALDARAVAAEPDWSLVPAVAELLAADQLRADDWAALAARLWMRCGPAPLEEAEAPFWRDLFHRGGYAVNGTPSGVHYASMRLWRGARPEWARGWAWADQRRVAELHASANGERSPVGRLWKTRATGAALLASIAHLRSGAMEVVVDPDQLGEVEPVEDVDPDPATWVTLGTRSRGIFDDPPQPSHGPVTGARLLGWR